MIKFEYKGVFIAVIIICCWFSFLFLSLNLKIDGFRWWILPLMLLQTHLYTGLFITAHDAMHGTVSRNQKINKAIGTFCALLFAFNFWNKLYAKHHDHHRFVATEHDPDFHQGNFFIWYFKFLKNYINSVQILLMGITFNLLILFFDKQNVVLFWMLPAMISTLQLFYFGTYLPHKGSFQQSNRHHASSFRHNDFLAFITCYFFGYHYEHHDSPSTPWWLLYKKKRTTGTASAK